MDRSWTPLQPAAALPYLEWAVEAFAATLADADPAAEVPTCPGWDLRTLAHHLGNVHRWARGAIVEGHPGTAEVEAPTGRAELAGWYRECADQLLDTLRRVDPDRPCWTFGPEPRTAGFWTRRQAHETTLHLLDAAAAAGDPAPGLDPQLALDGIDEVVGMFFPRQVRLGRIAPLPGPVALAATEGPRWILAGDGTGSDPSGGAQAQVEVLVRTEVRGPAAALLALLWHRTGSGDERLQVSGDLAVLDAVLAVALTP